MRRTTTARFIAGLLALFAVAFAVSYASGRGDPEVARIARVAAELEGDCAARPPLVSVAESDRWPGVERQTRVFCRSSQEDVATALVGRYATPAAARAGLPSVNALRRKSADVCVRGRYVILALLDDPAFAGRSYEAEARRSAELGATLCRRVGGRLVRVPPADRAAPRHG